MARALGVALAGPRSYDGQLRDFPFVNAEGARVVGADAVDRQGTPGDRRHRDDLAALELRSAALLHRPVGLRLDGR